MVAPVEKGSKYRKIAQEAARSVQGDLVAAFHEGMAVERKANFHDVVSRHDRRTESQLIDYISERCPGSAFLGEEGGQQGKGMVEWYVDPIDGTENFVSVIPFFCVSIAAAIAGEVVAGVVYDPLRDECFYADECGAYLNSEAIRSVGATTDANALLIAGYPDHQPWLDAPPNFEGERAFSRMIDSFRTVRRMGSSALSLAYVAAGRADVTFDVNVKPWDVAAGSFLVQKAGGTYVPLGETSGPIYEAPGYLALVRDFQLERSAIAPVSASAAAPGEYRVSE